MKRAFLAVLALLVLVAPFVPAQASPAAQSFDPRADNAKAFHVNPYTGKVDGVELVYQERPYTTYQLVQARLLDEQEAAGNTVAKFVVIDCFGTPISEKVWLAWAWPTLTDGHLLPGNANNEHMIMSPYNPPTVGPLAIYVGNGAGEPISDVIGGLGLPNKRHVSFYLAFRKRCGALPTSTPAPTSGPVPTVQPGPTVTPVPPVGDTETNRLLAKLLDAVLKLSAHLGVQ